MTLDLINERTRMWGVTQKVIPILGAGITGLLSAKAVSDSGYFPVVIDKDIEFKPNRFPGLHYLHDSCGLDLEPMDIRNYVVQDILSKSQPYEDYAEKLGTTLDNSVKRLTPRNEGFRIKDAYKILYDRFKVVMIQYEISTADIRDLIKNMDIVINTLPYNFISDIVGVDSKEVMKTVEVSVESDQKVIQDKIESYKKSVGVESKDIVIYNVDKEAPWYRYSCINGEELLEYTRKLPNCKSMKKVLSYKDKDLKKIEIYGHTLLNVSRYSNWDRKYLAHNSYYDVKSYLRINPSKSVACINLNNIEVKGEKVYHNGDEIENVSEILGIIAESVDSRELCNLLNLLRSKVFDLENCY